MVRTLVAIAFFMGCVLASEEEKDKPQGSGCGSCETAMAALNTQLVEAQAQLMHAKEAGHCQSFSVLKVGSKVWSTGGNVVNYALSQTELDEKVTSILTEHFSKGREFSAGLVDALLTVNHSVYIQDLKSHPVYVSHIAPFADKAIAAARPHVDKATAAVRPHVDQYVTPALDKATAQLAPAMNMASQKYNTAFDAFHMDVLPKVKNYGAQAYEKSVEAQALFDKRVLNPAFDAYVRVAPDHAAFLPQNSLDRVFFLLFSIFALYHIVLFGRKLLLLAFFVLRICFRVTWKIFSVFVLLPVSICFRILRLSLWIGTGFYCCGLCKRKSKASKLSDAATKANDDKNDKKVDCKKEDKAMKDATISEVTTLLENAKKEKKLDAAAKQLVGLVKSGKAMSTPKSMANKKVTKDVLTKACAKFKELDVKKLGM